VALLHGLLLLLEGLLHRVGCCRCNQRLMMMEGMRRKG
jgi:hypothetical protein